VKAFAYWGKAQDGWHPLPYHSLDVAACGLTLVREATRFGRTLAALLGLDQDALERLVGWSCALHDLGKFSPAFQWQAPDTVRSLGQPETPFNYDVRHDSLGWVLWSQALAPVLIEDADLQEIAAHWIRCATGHHGAPPSKSNGAKLVHWTTYFGEADRSAAEEWCSYATRHFAPPFHTCRTERLADATWWIAGLITLADWLGSSTEWFPYESVSRDIGGYWKDTCARAERAVAEAGLDMPETRRSFSALFPGYTPTDIQQRVSALPTDQPFFLAIEEATGGGKTEAALAAAGGDSFFFGLPTMATANGLWGRAGTLGGQQALAHGKRWTLPEAMSRATSWLNDSSRKAMLARIGVGTIDQAMLAVLYTRFSTLRLTGLCGRTLIIDEVHAYDDYMTEVLKVLVEFHSRAGGSVILLSATMPVEHRKQFSAAWARGIGVPPPVLTCGSFPLLTFISEAIVRESHCPSFRSRRVSVEYADDSSAVLDRIGAAAASGQCVCWIRNTVRDAIDAWSQLNSNGQTADLFHARFTVADRRRIENDVLSRFGKDSSASERAGRILVATQVVEQSLDLDFDLIVTDLAPVDLMLQRAGRLHRHDRGSRGTPKLILHGPKWSDEPDEAWVNAWSRGTARVYPDHGRLWLSARLLRAGFEEPADFRRLVQSVYGAESADVIAPELRGSTRRAHEAIERAKTAGWLNALRPGSEYSADGIPRWEEEWAPTRLGERSCEWVLFSDGSPINESVQDSSVAVRRSQLATARAAQGARVGPWQKTIDLTGGTAPGTRRAGESVLIRYDQKRGLLLE
jgi:CRISPR-associated endonuclease/helicase Cas3